MGLRHIFQLNAKNIKQMDDKLLVCFYTKYFKWNIIALYTFTYHFDGSAAHAIRLPIKNLIAIDI